MLVAVFINHYQIYYMDIYLPIMKKVIRRFNKNAFIEYKKPKFKIINIEIFKKYYAVLSDIKISENTYSEL